MIYTYKCESCETVTQRNIKLAEHTSTISCNSCEGSMKTYIDSVVIPKTNAQGDRVFSDIDKLKNQVRDDS